MRTILALLLLIGLNAQHSLAADVDRTKPVAHPRPTLGELMGLNVHTVQFKPDLYAPVCRRLRDYHPLPWDVGDDTSRATTFPLCVNKVDWTPLYGKWTKLGYEVDACVMFDGIKPGAWKDPAKDARVYGEAFAKFFGPSGKQPWVTSVEIGNEPADYSEAEYRTLFEAMARGLRAGDPKLQIVTCAVMTGKPDKWSKPIAAVAGLNDLYDVLNVHSYAMKDKWPTWRRSYPEDPSIDWIKSIQNLIDWRNANAPGKPVWLTEFGYDASSKPTDKTGEWSKWVGVTDEQQARYIVRSFLTLSAIDVDRAYLYFFNDKDEPKLHAASGITRDFKPKPSFHAMAHLYKSLADFRFRRAVVKTDGELYCYEYGKDGPSNERVYVAWIPTGSDKTAKKTLSLGKSVKVMKAEQMPLSAGQPKAVEFKQTPDGVEIELSESPVYMWVK